MATKKGMLIIPRSNNSLSHFTPLKTYEVIAGCGDENLNHNARAYGEEILLPESANVVDDLGQIRYVTMAFFYDLSTVMGLGR